MRYIRSGRLHKMHKDNFARVPNSPGIYKIYNDDKKLVYVGTTAGNKGKIWSKKTGGRYVYGLRHRLGSYEQKDDFYEHPTKERLRPHTDYFAYWVVKDPIKRKNLERSLKKGVPFNHR